MNCIGSFQFIVNSKCLYQNDYKTAIVCQGAQADKLSLFLLMNAGWKRGLIFTNYLQSIIEHHIDWAYEYVIM